MDPVTVALAVTGLTSSLITIAETIFKISKTLLEFQQKYKDAPRRILQLYNDLQNLWALVLVIKARYSTDEAINYPPALQTICESFTTQLEQDLRELQAIIDRPSTKLSIPISKKFRVQAKYVFSEGTMNEFHGRISTHFGYLSMVQTLVNK
jgi:hypothetical protein